MGIKGMQCLKAGDKCSDSVHWFPGYSMYSQASEKKHNTTHLLKCADTFSTDLYICIAITLTYFGIM